MRGRPRGPRSPSSLPCSSVHHAQQASFFSPSSRLPPTTKHTRTYARTAHLVLVLCVHVHGHTVVHGLGRQRLLQPRDLCVQGARVHRMSVRSATVACRKRGEGARQGRVVLAGVGVPSLRAGAPCRQWSARGAPPAAHPHAPMRLPLGCSWARPTGGGMQQQAARAGGCRGASSMRVAARARTCSHTRIRLRASWLR